LANDTNLNKNELPLHLNLVQQKLPLISDWIRCAPPLDVTSASNESPEEAKSAENPYEQSSSIDSLERNKEEVGIIYSSLTFIFSSPMLLRSGAQNNEIAS
jgi:hypothetical protein